MLICVISFRVIAGISNAVSTIFSKNQAFSMRRDNGIPTAYQLRSSCNTGRCVPDFAI